MLRCQLCLQMSAALSALSASGSCFVSFVCKWVLLCQLCLQLGAALPSLPMGSALSLSANGCCFVSFANGFYIVSFVCSWVLSCQLCPQMSAASLHLQSECCLVSFVCRWVLIPQLCLQMSAAFSAVSSETASFCSSFVNSEPARLRPKEFKFEAKKQRKTLLVLYQILVE